MSNVQNVNVVNGGSSGGGIASVVDATVTTSGFRLKASGSTVGGVEKGGVEGSHSYILSVDSLVLDTDAGVVLPLLAGDNVTAIPNGFEKSIAGNAWNSWCYSGDSFDPVSQDFAITIPPLVGGTVRQMYALDDAPNVQVDNNTFKSGEYSIYQVNSTFYVNVYQNGLTFNNGRGNITLAADELFHLRCESGVVTYGILKSDGSIDDVYTSTKKAVVPLYFKASFNRGVGSSGHSKITGVESYTTMKTKRVTCQLFGAANAPVTEQDNKMLAGVGLSAVAGSLYSDLSVDRLESVNFPDGIGYEYIHGYVVGVAQSSGEV